MKHIIQGVGLGTLVVPIATTLYHFVIWFAFGFNETAQTLPDMVMYGAMVGLPGAIFALGVLLLYGLPLFLLLRRFNLANWVSVAALAIAPWVVIDGFINQSIHHFIEFSWYSLASGFAFWLMARHSIAEQPSNA